VAGRGRSMAIVAMAAAVLLGGCQQVRDALGGPTDAQMLAAVSLTDDDVAPEATLEPYPDGNVVVGQTSLDLCYGSFPSEDLRVGRQQVGVGDASGEAWVSSEAILYSHPEQAEQAMAELEAAVRDCPSTAVAPPQDDRDPLVWQFDDAPDPSWPDQPGVVRQAYAFTVTGMDGQARSGTATYLQRGRMILALYATPADASQSTLRNSPDAARFTEVMARRLMAIPMASLRTPNPVAPVDDPNDVSA